MDENRALEICVGFYYLPLIEIWFGYFIFLSITKMICLLSMEKKQRNKATTTIELDVKWFLIYSMILVDVIFTFWGPWNAWNGLICIYICNMVSSMCLPWNKYAELL